MVDCEEFDLTAFSLVCETCDAGEGIGSEADALIAGWTDIEYRPDLPMANYCGVCPECREQFGRWSEADGG